jgi:hypothetical protein
MDAVRHTADINIGDGAASGLNEGAGGVHKLIARVDFGYLLPARE